MSIARDGVPIILAFIGLHLLFLLAGRLTAGLEHGLFINRGFWALAVMFAFFALFSLYFFRDPEREIPEDASLVVSPADGRVLSVEEVEEQSYIRGPADRVSIFMNIFDVHVNRFPVSGKVGFKEYRKGRFFNASLDKASVHNEALSLGIETAGGSAKRILVRQIAGFIARRVVCRVDVGHEAVRGGRYGMIKFGSRLEVFLPKGARWLVKPGDRVMAGESILAEFP